MTAIKTGPGEAGSAEHLNAGSITAPTQLIQTRLDKYAY
jgi:hypothetical protein